MRRLCWEEYTRILRVGLIAFLGMAILAGDVSPALAVTMMVNTSNDETNPNDGLCSLREAITDAVNRSQVDPACPVGTGNDLIVFAGGVNPSVYSPLPMITWTPSGASNIVTIYGGSDKKATLTNNLSSGDLFTVTSGGTLTIQNFNIVSNFLPGACVLSNGPVTLINETVTGCNPVVRATAGTVTLKSIVAHDVDTTLYQSTATLNITGSKFTSGGSGDYLFTIGTGGATIDRSTLLDAGISGLAIISIGPLTITRSMIGGTGGTGLSVGGTETSTLTNSIVTGQIGTGIQASFGNSSHLIVTNSTIAGNGQGIYQGDIHLRNTILANSGFDCYPNSTVTDEGGNMQLSNTCPASIFIGDPQLNSSFAPAAGTHAIDNGVTANCPAFDYYGAARPDVGDSTGTCDIGAVETNN